MVRYRMLTAAMAVSISFVFLWYTLKAILIWPDHTRHPDIIVGPLRRPPGEDVHHNIHTSSHTSTEYGQHSIHTTTHALAEDVQQKPNTPTRSLVEGVGQAVYTTTITTTITTQSTQSMKDSEHTHSTSKRPRPTDKCPSYFEYSQERHHPISNGPAQLPYMRPRKQCRTFKSPLVENIIDQFSKRASNPDLAQLFTNTYPNTLDTTIKWRNHNLTFIVTGDIDAEWLRDASNQISVYIPLVKDNVDSNLSLLIRNAINLQARYVSEYPYCGAFQPPPESGLKPVYNAWAANAYEQYPPFSNQTVFECKYELDSLMNFLKTATSYYENSKDHSILTKTFSSALDSIIKTIEDQSKSTVDDNGKTRTYYRFKSLRIPTHNIGAGEPKKANGMIGTAFRPSDDVVFYQFHTADNALAVVQLRKLAELLSQTLFRIDLVKKCKDIADRIEKAIWEHAVVEVPEYGKIFAYEIDGFGSRALMDDANVPSLMSLPYIGFLDAKNEIYQNTRKFLMSRDNPYYNKGPAFYGIGGPHINNDYPWPMNLISYMITSHDDNEIMDTLGWLINSTAGLGLIHESQNIHDPDEYTRPWFGWANSYFAEAILKIAQERPHLIFRD